MVLKYYIFSYELECYEQTWNILFQDGLIWLTLKSVFARSIEKKVTMLYWSNNILLLYSIIFRNSCIKRVNLYLKCILVYKPQ